MPLVSGHGERRSGCGGHQVFTFHQLKEQFQQEDAIGNGAIFEVVTKNDMLSVQLIEPPQFVVKSFEETAVPVFDQIAALTAKNANLHRTRDLLLQQLILG